MTRHGADGPADRRCAPTPTLPRQRGKGVEAELKQSVYELANIPKNRCRTTIAERMVETLAELPFIGNQVLCLSHDQAA